MPQSYKWISSDDTNSNSSSNQSKQLVVHDIRQVFPNISNQQINLISIFGRARQGKSFLMNCLAGEKEIFRISNEKESCTQGIDISDKWINLSAFESIDNPANQRIAKSSNIKVGFIDAEGQGDKDVSYDANLVCPILLVSKCVIFNWKGDLQKDHLLGTLGIMTRAAKNVNSIDKSKKFGHLHIIFRDWQATESDRNKVYASLFTQEKSSDESAIRNQIRKDVLDSFESVQVWLFDAPMESTKDLKKKLSYETTSLVFKSQLRSLRNSLSNQLNEPTYFSGKPITVQSIVPLINQVVTSLNKGESVMPSSIYVSMMKEELRNIYQSLENEVFRLVSTQSQILESKVSSSSNFPLENEFLKQVDEGINEIIGKHLEIITVAIGDESSSPLYSQITSDLPAVISNITSRAIDQLVSSYKETLSRWLLNAQNRLESHLINSFNAIGDSLPVPVDKLQQLINIVHDEVFSSLNQYNHPSAVKLSENLLSIYRKLENSVIDKNESQWSNINDIVHGAIEQMKKSIDETFDKMNKQTDEGFPIEIVEKNLNDEYIRIKSVILNQLNIYHLPTDKIEEIAHNFRIECGKLRDIMVIRYNDLLQRSYRSRYLLEIDEIDSELSELLNQLDSFQSIDVLLEEIDGLFEDSQISILESLANWSGNSDQEHEYIISPLAEYKALQVDRLQSLYASVKSSTSSMEIDREIVSQPIKKQATNRLSAAEEKEKARQYAISQGWIKDSTIISTTKSTNKSTPVKKPRKTLEDLSVARQRAKDWRDRVVGNDRSVFAFSSAVVDENNDSSNRIPVNKSPDKKQRKSNSEVQNGNADISSNTIVDAKIQARKEFEDRTNEKVSTIKSKAKK
eukprot:gene18697-24454_t